MTKEQYLAEIAELDKKSNEIKARISKIKNDYIEANKRFNIGDKVVITDYKGVGRFAFVSRIAIGYNKYDIQYAFRKCKKDGTQSMQQDYVRGAQRIELA